MKLWNFRGRQNTITEALQLVLPEHAVISLTGAGGKTTLMLAWARELASEGKKVVVTTTTHMLHPDLMDVSMKVLFADRCAPDEVDDILRSDGLVMVVSPDPGKPDKVIAPPSLFMEHIYRAADVVLIEADGSRRKPLKWPAAWEPVVPDNTDITVCVAGLSALGCKPEDVIYRAGEMPEALRRDVVNESQILGMLISHDGGQKGIRGEFRVFLNQADDEASQRYASRLQQMLSVCGIQSAWGTSHSRVAVILEAAGDSRRFGSNKLLHMMNDGRPMIASILDKVRALDVYKKIIVTQYDEVAALAPDFDIVMNDRPDLGISHSMQLGLEAAANADACMFCVCDQPYLKRDTLRRLIDAYEKGTAGIVSLAWQGKMCNPKIFSSRYRDELVNLSGDTGGRQIIAAHMDDLLLVEASAESETVDLDLPVSMS